MSSLSPKGTKTHSSMLDDNVSTPHQFFSSDIMLWTPTVLVQHLQSHFALRKSSPLQFNRILMPSYHAVDERARGLALVTIDELAFVDESFEGSFTFYAYLLKLNYSMYLKLKPILPVPTIR